MEIKGPSKTEIGVKFYKSNQKLLEVRRKKLDQERKVLKEDHYQKDHWLRCPKCSSRMLELSLLGIIIEKCDECSGLYFDSGELETLLEITDRRGFFESLKQALGN